MREQFLPAPFGTITNRSRHNYSGIYYEETGLSQMSFLSSATAPLIIRKIDEIREKSGEKYNSSRQECSVDKGTGIPA